MECGQGAVRAWMPGAFARLGPRLAADFLADTGQPVGFAAFRPSGILAHAILAGESADVYVSANVLWMLRLQRAGIVRHWATLARNRLCVIARQGVAPLAAFAIGGLVAILVYPLSANRRTSYDPLAVVGSVNVHVRVTTPAPT